MTDPVAAAITQLAREESGRVLSLLARRFGDLDLADEAVQDALVEAAESWRHRGIPDNPAAWLYTVARNGAIDRLRRDASARRRMLAAAPELIAAASIEPEEYPIVDEADVGDESLRLLLLCCHPSLDQDTQVALTLRLAGGLTTTEIAAAFLVPEATLAQRIVRAKRKIRLAGIPLSILERLDERVDALLTILLLVFNESYLARASDRVVRVDLAEEAIRLTRHALAVLPENAEVEGLLALELFHHSRAATRERDGRELILLEEQDRTMWDSTRIAEGNAVLASALARMSPGPFQVQALIASHHANARTAQDTDWPAIAELYTQLLAMTGSPVVALNRAVAIAMADGPAAGLTLLEAIDGLDEYHLFHAARGELLSRCGRTDDARTAFARATQLTSNASERRHLERRIARLR